MPAECEMKTRVTHALSERHTRGAPCADADVDCHSLSSPGLTEGEGEHLRDLGGIHADLEGGAQS